MNNKITRKNEIKITAESIIHWKTGLRKKQERIDDFNENKDLIEKTLNGDIKALDSLMEKCIQYGKDEQMENDNYDI